MKNACCHGCPNIIHAQYAEKNLYLIQNLTIKMIVKTIYIKKPAIKLIAMFFWFSIRGQSHPQSLKTTKNAPTAKKDLSLATIISTLVSRVDTCSTSTAWSQSCSRVGALNAIKRWKNKLNQS